MAKSVQKLLRQGKKEVAKGMRWEKLCSSLSIGQIKHKVIVFSDEDLIALRNYFSNLIGSDIYTFDFNKDRTTLAKKTANEKVGKQAVFSHLIQVARQADLPIIINGQSTFTPVGSLISTPIELLDLPEKVVLVENGETIIYWNDIRLPDECEGALIIYRGHGVAAREILDVIANSPNTVVYAYCDFDPAGLMIASSISSNIILPENWASLTQESGFLKKFNKRDCFIKQRDDIKSLRKKGNKFLESIINHIESHEIAITQECVTAHNLKLIVMDLSN
ncbi:MAG: hypothetical protein JKX87_07415 [Cycloclasticus sp.]|nr:hypothetical protein [Cycloclasticus sp.]